MDHRRSIPREWSSMPIDEQHIDATTTQLDGEEQACRAGTHDKHVDAVREHARRT